MARQAQPPPTPLGFPRQSLSDKECRLVCGKICSGISISSAYAARPSTWESCRDRRRAV